MLTQTIHTVKNALAILIVLIGTSLLIGCEGSSSPLGPNLQAPPAPNVVPQTITASPGAGDGEVLADTGLEDDEDWVGIDDSENDTNPSNRTPDRAENDNTVEPDFDETDGLVE